MPAMSAKRAGFVAVAWAGLAAYWAWQGGYSYIGVALIVPVAAYYGWQTVLALRARRNVTREESAH